MRLSKAIATKRGKTKRIRAKRRKTRQPASSMVGRRIAMRYQARSREFALRGLFWILEKPSNDLDPDFNRALISLSRFFVQFEVISKKKRGLHRNLNVFFRPKLGGLQKKRSSPKFSHFFWPTLGEIQKKTPVLWYKSQEVLHDFGSPIPLEGYFHFWSKNRSQKH